MEFASKVAIGKTHIEGVIDCPVKDKRATVRYSVYASTNGGKTWEFRVGGTLDGDKTSYERQSAPGQSRTFSFSHDGTPCDVRVDVDSPQLNVRSVVVK